MRRPHSVSYTANNSSSRREAVRWHDHQPASGYTTRPGLAHPSRASESGPWACSPLSSQFLLHTRGYREKESLAHSPPFDLVIKHYHNFDVLLASREEIPRPSAHPLRIQHLTRTTTDYPPAGITANGLLDYRSPARIVHALVPNSLSESPPNSTTPPTSPLSALRRPVNHMRKARGRTYSMTSH